MSSFDSPWFKAKAMPSNPIVNKPYMLVTGEDLIDLITLRGRFRIACRTILQAEGVHPSAKRFAEEGLRLEYRESIVACAKDILVILESSSSASHVAYVAKQTLKTITERR